MRLLTRNRLNSPVDYEQPSKQLLLETCYFRVADARTTYSLSAIVTVPRRCSDEPVPPASTFLIADPLNSLAAD
ncbi:hypothetical protein HanIR_Chr16g0845081 [Helianthus annuus]|nr:hypothetical protein HanIR_Chr16g0845081 [Helianthus annuus]